jgi:hypothetical protein
VRTLWPALTGGAAVPGRSFEPVCSVTASLANGATWTDDLRDLENDDGRLDGLHGLVAHAWLLVTSGETVTVPCTSRVTRPSGAMSSRSHTPRACGPSLVTRE